MGGGGIERKGKTVTESDMVGTEEHIFGLDQLLVIITGFNIWK